VVTRPGVDIGFSHVTDEIRSSIVDLRSEPGAISTGSSSEHSIYITDAVDMDISATEIRHSIRKNVTSWREDVPAEVANYIEKYQIYN
jgi:nicotinic acid mononucleotide adenylyltransferase